MKGHIILFVLGILLISGCATQEPPLEELVSEEGGFSIMLPGEPKFETKTINTISGYLTANIYAVEANGIAYAVIYMDYPEEAIVNLTTGQILDNARDGAVTGSFGTLLNEEIISIEGYPGREITIAVEGGGVRERMYIVNNRLYQVIIATSSDKIFIKTISNVLNSFKLLEHASTALKKSESGFKEYKNSDIGIKSMIYPEDWSFVVSEDKAVASFSSPDKIAGFDIGVYIYDESISLETFHSRLLEMFPEEPDVEFTILDEEIKEINNHKWLISNRIVKINDVSIWQRFGLILTGYYDNKQTIQIVMETDEEHFEEYKLLFDKIVKSIIFTI